MGQGGRGLGLAAGIRESLGDSLRGGGAASSAAGVLVASLNSLYTTLPSSERLQVPRTALQDLQRTHEDTRHHEVVPLHVRNVHRLRPEGCLTRTFAKDG